MVGLDYPHTEEFDMKSREDIVKLVCWLEDRKIRLLGLLFI